VTRSVMEQRDDEAIHKVVMNDEEQHSIWPAEHQNPLGWHDVGMQGRREECLSYVNQHWTDIRPRGLRRGVDR